MSPFQPPHGKALWNGTLSMPPASEARDIITGEKLSPTVTVGSVILADWDNEARSPGRHGLVVSIDPDEDGQPVYTVLTHRRIRDRTEAWTFTMPCSEVRPENVVPDGLNPRHSYAIAALRSVCDSRWVTPEGFRLIGVATGLVRDCLWGGKG